MRVAKQHGSFRRALGISAAVQHGAALGLLLALASPGAAADDCGAGADRDAFQAAMELLGRDDESAARALEALADAHPEGEFAPDALLEAAQLAEEKLGHPDRAAALYGRLVAHYPSSRLSIRARARRDFLTANLAGGAAPLAEYQEILLRYAARPPAESRARMERLVAEHPDFPLADDGRLWLARSDLEDGHFESAMARFEEVERHAAPEAARSARKGRADAVLAAGHPLLARALYRSLLDGDRASAEAARAGLAATTAALVGLALFAISLAYLALFLGACAWQARRGLAGPLPVELKFFLPVAALFLLAAARANRPIFVATAAIALGGAAVIWLGGAATIGRLGRGPLSSSGRLGRALATGMAVAAISYAAVHLTCLTDVVVETLRHGPDR